MLCGIYKEQLVFFIKDKMRTQDYILEGANSWGGVENSLDFIKEKLHELNDSKNTLGLSSVEGVLTVKNEGLLVLSDSKLIFKSQSGKLGKIKNFTLKPNDLMINLVDEFDGIFKPQSELSSKVAEESVDEEESVEIPFEEQEISTTSFEEQETSTTSFEEQETSTTSLEKQEIPVTSLYEKETSVISLGEQEIFTTSIDKREVIANSLESQEILTTPFETQDGDFILSDIQKTDPIPYREQETNSTSLEEQETNSTFFESQETNHISNGAQETISIFLETQETVSPSLETQENIYTLLELQEIPSTTFELQGITPVSLESQKTISSSLESPEDDPTYFESQEDVSTSIESRIVREKLLNLREEYESKLIHLAKEHEIERMKLKEAHNLELKNYQDLISASLLDYQKEVTIQSDLIDIKIKEELDAMKEILNENEAKWQKLFNLAEEEATTREQELEIEIQALEQKVDCMAENNHKNLSQIKSDMSELNDVLSAMTKDNLILNKANEQLVESLNLAKKQLNDMIDLNDELASRDILEPSALVAAENKRILDLQELDRTYIKQLKELRSLTVTQIEGLRLKHAETLNTTVREYESKLKELKSHKEAIINEREAIISSLEENLSSKEELYRKELKIKEDRIIELTNLMSNNEAVVTLERTIEELRKEGQSEIADYKKVVKALQEDDYALASMIATSLPRM